MDGWRCARGGGESPTCVHHPAALHTRGQRTQRPARTTSYAGRCGPRGQQAAGAGNGRMEGGRWLAGGAAWPNPLRPTWISPPRAPPRDEGAPGTGLSPPNGHSGGRKGGWAQMRGATGIHADVDVDVDDRRTRLTKPLRHNQREPKSLPPPGRAHGQGGKRPMMRAGHAREGFDDDEQDDDHVGGAAAHAQGPAPAVAPPASE